MQITPEVSKMYIDNFYPKGHYDHYFSGKIKWQEKANLEDPEINVRIGIWYLRHLQTQLPEQCRQSKKHLVSAYNNGIGWLKKHNYQPPKSHKNKIYNRIYKGEL